MSELEEFRAMLRLSGHGFIEESLDQEEAPGYVVLRVVPDVHKQVEIRFTFDDDGDLSSLHPAFPSNWEVTIRDARAQLRREAVRPTGSTGRSRSGRTSSGSDEG